MVHGAVCGFLNGADIHAVHLFGGNAEGFAARAEVI